MAEKRVIEYEAASELANDDWLLIDGVTEGTRKARPSTVTAELGQQVTNLASTVGGLTQVAMGHEQSFAPDYDESASYDVGDLVMQYHGLYKCTAPTTGTWDAGKWARTEVSEQLEESGKIDDVQVNGVSVVTDKVAEIDLTDMQADIDSKQADTKIGGASILDNNKEANLDFLASYGEASGEIASFNDGAAMPLKSLKVGIEPVQDLHGYDHPWVGGSGKNKFKTDFNNTTINGTTITKTSDGRVLTSGVPTSAFDFVIGHVSLPAGSYILNGCPANGGADKYKLQVTDYPVVHNLGLDYGSGVSFTLEHDMEIAVRIQIYTGASATLEYKPMIRLATVSDSTFEPYENICPISGWSAVNATRSGKNLLNPLLFAQRTGFTNMTVSVNNDVVTIGPYDSGGRFVGFFVPAKVNSSYTISFESTTNIKANEIRYTSVDSIVSNFTPNSNMDIIRSGATVTVRKKFILIQFGMSSGDYASITKLQVEESTSATTYEPYNGTTYTTTLKDEQGNPMACYGGKLTNENGVQSLVLTHGYIASYNGETLPSTWISDRDVYAEGTTPTTGAELVYELATPQQIPQDNLAISTQDGTNNIWADSGDILECKYVRDNSVVINDLIARVTALENA